MNNDGVIKIVSTKTGEIKDFSGSLSAHKYMLECPEYIVWSA